MSNIIKFNVDNKELFLFELDGKTATIAPELIAFEGYANPKQSWNDLKSREEFEDGFEFKTLQGEELKVFKDILKSYDHFTLVSEIHTTLYDQYKSVPRLDIVLLEGIYGVMYSSNSGHANKFKKFMRRKVNSQLDGTGKFDVVENQIMQIEDEKEKTLRMKIKTYEDVLKVDSTDLMAINMLNNYKMELNSYINSKQIEEVKEKLNAIEDKVNRSVVVREGDCTGEAVARKFSVFSINNKPHNKFAEHLSKELGIYISPDANIGHQDDYVTVNLLQRGGEEVPTIRYSKKAIELMKEYIESNGLVFDEIEYGQRGKNAGSSKEPKSHLEQEIYGLMKLRIIYIQINNLIYFGFSKYSFLCHKTNPIYLH